MDEKPNEIEVIRRRIAEHERLLSQVSGYYVYGIVGGERSQPVEGLPEKGIDPVYPVYALQPAASSQQPAAISAIVSKVSLQEFGQEELESNLEDIKWLQAKVLAHQRVLEAVSGSHTLVPMRFCTIYQSESRVQEMLARHHDDFVATLARLAGKQEWGVKVYCDGKTMVQRVEKISNRVKELKAEMEQKSSGAAYFLKKKVDEAIAEEMERISDEYAQRSHDRLSNRSKEAAINPLRSKELTGRKEAMVLNGAYLVAEVQLAAFRDELESLGEEYDDLGFIYEVTGPWPPYNFASIGFEEGVAGE
ncbi:MAG: GvpL/GvpF family gas vesicle protein [Chloroflexi bacterium]|nr:GvpL/GvpF family gas vesicle protein [Chloroflexota bacterium]